MGNVMKLTSSKIISVLFSIVLMPLNLSAAAKPSIEIAMVEKKILSSTIEVHGSIYGRKNVTLTSGIAGRLEYVVEPGTRLSKGELVAKFDLVPLNLLREEQLLVIERSKINLDFQEIELRRYKKLAQTESAAQYQMDLTQNHVNLAKSDINLAKLKLKQIENQILRSTIIAPFSGVVGKQYQRAGSEVNRAVDLVQFVDTKDLEVKLFLPIKYLNYIEVGQAVMLTGDSFRDKKLMSAHLSAIIPITDPRSQTFEVRAQFEPDSDMVWAAGEIVDVKVEIKHKQEATLVDRDALIIRQRGIHIVKIDSDNVATQIPVEVGNGQEQLVEVSVKSGNQILKLGDRVAIRGAERLTSGQKVDVKS